MSVAFENMQRVVLFVGDMCTSRVGASTVRGKLYDPGYCFALLLRLAVF